MSSIRLRRSSAVALCMVLACAGAQAQHNDHTDRMLSSVVYVECIIEFQGEMVDGGSGTGVLVAGGDHAVTNNHVIKSCNPDNKILFVAERVYASTMADIKARKYPELIEKELSADPAKLERVKADAAYREQYFQDVARRIAAARAKVLAPNIVQKLHVIVLGKTSKDPVKLEVSRILWNSDTSNAKAAATGVDIAVLKLDRVIPDGTPVEFATGESARVNDQVYAVGFPGASGNAVRSNRYVPTLKRGIVSKLSGESPFMTDEARNKGMKGAAVIETDAAISGGNSGGPLFNDFGEVLGINTFGSSRAAGVNWAIDAAVVVPILQDLGLPPPRVRTAPPNWFERNETAVLAGAGGVAALLLLGFGAAVLRRPARAAAKLTLNGAAATGMAASAPAQLVGREGQFRGIAIPIPTQGLELGRGMPADGRLAFADDSDVSRHHALVTFNPTSRRFQVTDLGSANGTASLPDERRLADKLAVEFRSGQVIRLGKHNVFELRIS